MGQTLTFRLEDARIDPELIQQTANQLEAYLERLRSTAERDDYEWLEGSINLPFDRDIRTDVAELVDRVSTDALEYIVVVGIGGSNLGTLAVYEALRGTMSHLDGSNPPQILFADTVDPEKLTAIQSALQSVEHPDEFLINIVTKSGTTTETISNAEFVLGGIRDAYEAPEERVVVTTDEGSQLWNAAQEKGFHRIAIPEKVGGRFSVLSAVGQFPLQAAGIDVENLLQGAADMRDRCLTNDVHTNPALASAALLYLYYQRGVDIYNNFFFNPQMESVGKWYRQLIGESIGKQYNRENQQVRTGITPVISIGSTDLHSMAQLYFGGPRDKFTNLIYAPTEVGNARIPSSPFLGQMVSGIYDKDVRTIMTAIYEGVKATYRNEELPFIEVQLEDLSAYSIGGFLQYNMISIMMLADLLDIDAFNQPNVEGYKEETRKRL